MLFTYITLILASYFFGAVPFMILIGRLKGIDLSREPDLHHALWYKVGRRWGTLGFLLDVAKGIVPVLVGYLLQFPTIVAVLSGIASLCGQMWPVFRHFNGERGNTTGVGADITFSVAWGAPLICIIGISFAFIGFLVRTINRWQQSGQSLNERLKFGGTPSLALPLGVITGFISCVVISPLFAQPAEITLGYAGVAALIIIRRLTAGITEDLRKSSRPCSVLINRLLFDRSEI